MFILLKHMRINNKTGETDNFAAVSFFSPEPYMFVWVLTTKYLLVINMYHYKLYIL